MRVLRVRFTKVAMILLLIGAILYSTHGFTQDAAAPIREKVMAIGGSVAYGWKDVKGQGYIHRAFESYQTFTHDTYAYFNRAIVGANGLQLGTMYKGDFTKWLKTVHPSVVVISWGLLNDASPNTLYPVFAKYLREEIQTALRFRAVVLVVSPPITKATYTEYPVQEEKYDKTEARVVKSLNSPNVFYVDLLNQMKRYLTSHHETYKPYKGDGWHPNTRGHILAGKLLEMDIVRIFKKGPVTLRT